MEKVTKDSFPKEFFVEGSEWFTVNYKNSSILFVNFTEVIKSIHLIQNV